MTRPKTTPAPCTRDRLLDAAERLFAARGFAETSVRAITEAAGANLGAVNYDFRSKDALYGEVFLRRAAMLRDPLRGAAREAMRVARTDPDQALRVLGRAFLAQRVDRTRCGVLADLFARETIERRLPAGLLVREFLVPALTVITDIVRLVRPALSEPTARACAHSFFAQLMHIVKGTAAHVVPDDAPLEHAVRFTVAAIRHLEEPPPVRGRRRSSDRSSSWSA